MRKLALLPLALALAGAALAQAAPDGGPGGHEGPGGGPPHGAPMGPGGGGPGGVPSPEMLASLPGITPAQQIELRKLLIARRDAHDALRDKERSEHEHVDDQSAERIRKLLGEEGYRTYAQAGGPHGPEHGGPGHDGPVHDGGPGRGDRHDGTDHTPPKAAPPPPAAPAS